jgi:hypothetical protein
MLIFPGSFLYRSFLKEINRCNGCNQEILMLSSAALCYDAIRCNVMLCFEYLNIRNITSHRSYFSKIRNNVASQLCFEYSKRNIASDIGAMFVNEKGVGW